MAKGFDALIEHLLAEIALCGARGATSADFRRFVEKFYNRKPDDSNTSDGPDLHFDTKFLSAVWGWLIAHRDVRILHNDKPAHLTFTQFESHEIPEEPGEPEELTATQLAFHAESSTSAADNASVVVHSENPACANSPSLSQLLHQQLELEQDELPPGATPVDPPASSAPAKPHPVSRRPKGAGPTTSQPQKAPPKPRAPVTASDRPVSRGCPDLAADKLSAPLEAFVRGYRKRTAKGQKITGPVFPKPGVSTKSPRLFVSQDRTWQAVAGHSVDYKKISHMEFVLLSIIASRGAEGILQPELRRISGQDKRSVPKRTDDLAKKGYIEKKSVSALKTRTSICVHKKFVKECVFTGTGKAGGGVQSVVVGRALILSNLVTYLYELMKETRVIAVSDLRRKLGISPKMWNSKGLIRAIRRLEKTGYVLRVRAKVKGTKNSWLNCIKLLRDPIENDVKALNFKRKAFGGSSDTLPAIDEDRDGDDIMRDLELEVDHNGPVTQVPEKADDDDEVGEKVQMAPQWAPDRQLGHLIYRAAKLGGQNGSNTRILRAYAMGPFWRRPLEVLVCHLTDHWERTQPKHLRHFAIIRDTTVTNELKFVHYIYRTYDNFQKAVDAGEASWEAVSKEAAGQTTSKRGRPKKVTEEPDDEADELGFSSLGTDAFLVPSGTTTLRDARSAIRTDPSREKWDKPLMNRFGIKKNVNPPPDRHDESIDRPSVKYKRRNVGHADTNAKRASKAKRAVNAKQTQMRRGGLLTLDQRAALGLNLKGRLKREIEEQIHSHIAGGGTVDDFVQAHQDEANPSTVQPTETTEVRPSNAASTLPPQPLQPLQPRSTSTASPVPHQSTQPRTTSVQSSLRSQTPQAEASIVEALPLTTPQPSLTSAASALPQQTPQLQLRASEASASSAVVDQPQNIRKKAAKRTSTGLLTVEQRAALDLPSTGRLSKKVEEGIRNHIASGGTVEDYVLARQKGAGSGTSHAHPINGVTPSSPASPLPPLSRPGTAKASASRTEVVSEPRAARKQTGKRTSAASNEVVGQPKTPRKEPAIRITTALFTPEQRVALGIPARGRLKKSVEEHIRNHVTGGGTIEDYVLTYQIQPKSGTSQSRAATPSSAAPQLPPQSRPGNVEVLAATSGTVDHLQTAVEHDQRPLASTKRKRPLAADTDNHASKKTRLSATSDFAVPQLPTRVTPEQPSPLDRKRTAPAESQVPTPKKARVEPAQEVADLEPNDCTGQTETGENGLPVLPSVESGPEPIPVLTLSTTSVVRRANTIEPARIDKLPRKQQRAIRKLREEYDNRTEPGVYTNPYMTRKVARGRPRRAFMVVVKSDRLREKEWFKAAPPPPEPPHCPTAKPKRLVLRTETKFANHQAPPKRNTKDVITNRVSRLIQFNYGLGRTTSTPKQPSTHTPASFFSAPEHSVADRTEARSTRPHTTPHTAPQEADQRDASQQDESLRDGSREDGIPQEVDQRPPHEAPEDIATDHMPYNDASTSRTKVSTVPTCTVFTAVASSASNSNTRDPEITVLQQKPKINSNAISKRGVVLGRGYYNLLRTEIFMELFKRCNGVFPGNGEIYEPFYTLWSKRAPKNANQPDKGTLIKNVKKLVDNGTLKLLAFTFQTSYGLPITKRILALPEIDPSSPVVHAVRKQLIEHHNQRWFPEEVKDLVAEEAPKGHYPKDDVEVQPLLAEKRLEERIAASTNARKKAEDDRRARLAEERRLGLGGRLSALGSGSLTTYGGRRVVGYVDDEIENTKIEETSPLSSDYEDEMDGDLGRFKFVNNPAATSAREDSSITDDLNDYSSESDLDTDADEPTTSEVLDDSETVLTASTKPTALPVKGRRTKRQAVSREVIEQTPAQIEEQYNKVKGIIDADGWQHLSPAVFDKDYEWIPMTSLLNPDTHFHSKTGTFSTEFSFRRNARLELWIDPNKKVPKTLQEISLLGLGQQPRDTICFAHEKEWLKDPSHERFWQDVYNVVAWEEQFLDCSPDFIHRWMPSDPFINLTYPGKQITAPVERKKDYQKWVFSADCITTPFTVTVKEPVPKKPGPRPRIVLVENENGELVPQPPRTRRRGPNKPKEKVMETPPPLRVAELEHDAEARAAHEQKVREVQNAYKEQQRRTINPTPVERLTGLTGDAKLRTHGTRPTPYKLKTAKGAGNRRKEPERKPVEHDQFKMLFYALVIAAVMVDTPRHDVDWKIVEATYKQNRTPLDLENARKMWSFLNENLPDQVESLKAEFQEKFLTAYEEGKVPAMDNMDSYEWLKVVEWAMKNCKFPEMPLPRDIENFRDGWNIIEDSYRRFNREEWYKMGFPAYVKENKIVQYQYACPIHGSETTEPLDEDAARARSWVRSNCATPTEMYDADLAHEKLMNLGGETIDKTLTNLLERKILRPVKGAKVVPGRNFDFTSTSAHDFRRTLEFEEFMDAVAFKKALDAAFLNPDPAKRYLTIPPNAKDGTVMSLSMLVASKRVEIIPRLPPVNNKYGAPFPRLSVWGFIERDYRSRYLDRRLLEWPMDIIPTENYRFGNPLADSYAPGTSKWDTLPPPPLPDQNNPKAPIPIWVAIDGKTIIYAWWERVLNVVIQAILFQPGTNTYDIHLVSNRAIEIFEIELCISWLDSVGAVSCTRGGSGHYMVQENWWCVFGDRLRQEKDWFGEVVKRKPVPYGQGWRYALQTRDESWVGRRRGKKPKPLLEPGNVQMGMLARVPLGVDGLPYPTGVQQVQGDVVMGGMETAAAGGAGMAQG